MTRPADDDLAEWARSVNDRAAHPFTDVQRVRIRAVLGEMREQGVAAARQAS